MILPWLAWNHISSRVWNHRPGIIKVYGSRLIIDWTIYFPEYGQAGTINFAFLWFQVDHRLDHICPEYGQPGTITLYGPEYDQPGILLWVWWQSMIDLLLYGMETRVAQFLQHCFCHILPGWKMFDSIQGQAIFVSDGVLPMSFIGFWLPIYCVEFFSKFNFIHTLFFCWFYSQTPDYNLVLRYIHVIILLVWSLNCFDLSFQCFTMLIN